MSFSLKPGLWSLTDLFSNSLPLDVSLVVAFQWGCTAGVGESILSDTVVRLTVGVAVVKVLVVSSLLTLLLDLELSTSPLLGLEVWLVWSLSSLWTCQVDAENNSKLDYGVLSQSALLPMLWLSAGLSMSASSMLLHSALSGLPWISESMALAASPMTNP